MDASAESVVRNFLAAWRNPSANHLGSFLADDAVWVDGPNGVHSGSREIVDELLRQLSIPSDSWLEIDTLLAADGVVMVEWHGGLRISGRSVATRVMAGFEVDQGGRINVMREVFDMKSLLDQMVAGGGPDSSL